MSAPPVQIGFHCSHEQHPPSRLLRFARLAAEAGFVHAMCSDHFHPWSERQGHSGFTWSWLGAVMQATRLSLGTVCAPGQRYHPAVVAQAAATVAEMFPGRFWLAVGSGEALNESITGDPWPSKTARNERLRECATIMRDLWAGRIVSHRGHVTVREARLYSVPPRPPLLVGAAITPDTARWVAGWADALVTVAGGRDAMRAVVDAFRAGGGEDKPMYLQVTSAFAPTRVEAERAAMDQWRHAALGTGQLADVARPTDFDRLSAGVTLDEVKARVRISADIEQHLAWLHDDATLGFERLYLHNVAREHQERFIEACAARVLPAFATAPTGGAMTGQG